ncbi:MAG TPA: ectoine/hydroxyectoine ABC transporter permease subunit EhuC [Beijerinckiaceae bacterium]|nr:ectoine/hydroxyectoine ABC transporter permease subunit EhuC [Beijerinckiaceae bacterium]
MNSAPSLVSYLPFLLQGVWVTLLVTFLAILLAVPLAVLLAVARNSRVAILTWSAGFVVELFRGTSALVQLFWAFYVLPFFGINLPPLLAGVLVLGCNEASYFSEAVRAALNAVPAGQREAAIALHLSPAYRFFRIILPQALPILVPPFGNALVTTLKFTALVSLVTIQDLSFRAETIRTALGGGGAVFGIALIIYFILAYILGGGVKLIERGVNRRAGRDVGSLLERRSNIPDWALGGGR